MEDKMKHIVSLAKRRGFVFQSSEIYGGVEALWDFGPLGAAMKQNIKKAWLSRFVQQMDNVVVLESAILMHADVWKASGHIENFTDPLVECKKCNKRFRADQIKGMPAKLIKAPTGSKAEIFAPPDQFPPCPNCGAHGSLTDIRMFSLMFKTFLGPVEDASHVTYLRPETAQGMFVNFKLVQESMRQKLPFGIAQTGKAFRNEITTGNFIFRSREFEQMEIEYFVKPGEDEKWFDFWVDQWEQFFLSLGLKKENLRRYEHPKESLAHYSKRTVDIEYKFPFGWGELAGVANRTDFDLKQHSKFSGQDLSYRDEETGKNFVPYVIEPTLGVERLLLALLIDAYEEVEGGRTTTTESTKEKEIVLKLSAKVAPVQVAVFPLLKNKPELVAKAKEAYHMLQKEFTCQYDAVGAIGRRYRRQDEIGTPFCVTIDFETLEKNDVTLRDRDTMEQVRVSLDALSDELRTRLTP